MSTASRARKLDKIIADANANYYEQQQQQRPCFQVFWCPSAKKWRTRDLGNSHTSRSGRSRTIKTS